MQLLAAWRDGNERAGGRLVERHYAETKSRKAEEILQHWEENLPKFVQVCPKEMLDKLTYPLAPEGQQAIPAE